jgi:hypothetical protein
LSRTKYASERSDPISEHYVGSLSKHDPLTKHSDLLTEHNLSAGTLIKRNTLASST